MKVPLVVSLALVLSVSSGFAEEINGPLPAGKPAGVHQAQLEGSTGMLIVAGAALAGITIALATASDNNAKPTTSTTSTTSTNP